MRVYLDNSATTKPSKEVIKAMMNMYEEDFGNPSSLHKMGLEAEKKVREVRKIIGKSLGFNEKEIYFTSGGTESDNLALLGIKSKKKNQSHIITTKVEHPAILETCKRLESQGYKIDYLSVDKDCNINLEELKSLLTEDTLLVSIMSVNNEVGTILDILGASEIIKNNSNAYFHTDAVQALGKIKIDDFPFDLISISGHKIHSSKGIGAIGIKKSINIKPIILGGGQEKNIRSGTENVPGIIGLGKAVSSINENLYDDIEYVGKLKTYLKRGLIENVDDIVINTPENSSNFILNVSFLNVRGEVLLHILEQDGIMISTGSACSSGKKGGSHVLKAMGKSQKEIEGAIRFSLSKYNTFEEIDYTISKVKEGVAKIRKLGSFR